MKLPVAKMIEFVESEWFEFRGMSENKGLIYVLYEIQNKLSPELKGEYIRKLTDLYTNFSYLFSNHSSEDWKHNEKWFKRDWNKCINSYSRLMVFEELVRTLGNKEFLFPKEIRVQFYRFKDLHLKKETCNKNGKIIDESVEAV